MLLSPFNITIQVIQKVFCTPARSNLPGESIARGRERVLLFVNRGKSPLFYKKQYQK